MNYAAKALCLSTLLGVCFLLAGGELPTDDALADLGDSELTRDVLASARHNTDEVKHVSILENNLNQNRSVPADTAFVPLSPNGVSAAPTLPSPSGPQEAVGPQGTPAVAQSAPPSSNSAPFVADSHPNSLFFPEGPDALVEELASPPAQMQPLPSGMQKVVGPQATPAVAQSTPPSSNSDQSVVPSYPNSFFVPEDPNAVMEELTPQPAQMQPWPSDPVKASDAPLPSYQTFSQEDLDVVSSRPGLEIPGGDCLNGSCPASGSQALIGGHQLFQHPAPEVVLRRGVGCAAEALSNWSLSSRDVPKARPSIPHGPLTVELRAAIQPVEFVELMLDGQPLKPTNAMTGSLNYDLPCPNVGPHVLQARYLSGNRWSAYSNPLRFEVRLPPQPRIIAASDFDRDPTPLVRNSTTSVRTHSIKVHLADVNRGDPIIGYVDGKPLTSESDGEPCCRVFRVQGIVTPGIHKLTVRAAGCPGNCSITSQPSNEIAFHYYEEDVYLLKPGAGCKNKLPREDCPPKLNAMNGLVPSEQQVLPGDTTQMVGVIDSPQLSSGIKSGSQDLGSDKFTSLGARRRSDKPSEMRFVTFLQDGISQRVEQQDKAQEDLSAEKASEAIRKALEKLPLPWEAQAEVTRCQKQVNSAKTAVRDASSYLRNAEAIWKDTTAALKSAEDSAVKAKQAADRANDYAVIESRCDDKARARVARRHADLAEEYAQRVFEEVTRAVSGHRETEAVCDELRETLGNAIARLESAETFCRLAKEEFEKFLSARADAEAAQLDAKEASDREEKFRADKDRDGARNALGEVLLAKGIAEARSHHAIAHAKMIKQYAGQADKHRAEAWGETNRAKQVAEAVVDFKAVVREAAADAAQLADAAASQSQHAGRVLEKDADTEQSWDEAEQQAAFEAAKARLKAANAGSDENGVRRALETARAAVTREMDEWKKAGSRVAEAKANASRARAASVVGPPSPFYFASAAHIPLPAFGLRGEHVDREGVVIYEDMKFSFDRNGKYKVHFRASTPEMPVTMRLQFQIQPHRGGPWYTVTLSPIEFPYPPAKERNSTNLASCCGDDPESKDCCGEVHECTCKGKSAILRRCYGEMGQDARIRRTGTARFGFGVDVDDL